MNIQFLSFKLVCRFLSSYYSVDDLGEFRYQLTRNSGVRWESVIDIANYYLVAPALWSGLKSKGLETLVELEACEYLGHLYELNQNRNTHLRQQLLEVIGILNAVGITPLLLKGASQLVHPIHKDIGSRIMADLDILIPPKEVSIAADALANKGYEKADIRYDPEKLHHWTPLIRRGEYGMIELHHQALDRFVTHVMPTQKLMKAAEPNMIEGVQFLLPCPTHSIMICLLHSQDFDYSGDPREFNLRALNDLAAINLSYSDIIDWQLIHCTMKDNGLKYLIESYLIAARRLFGMSYPLEIMPGPSARLHYIISLGAMRCSMVELLSRRMFDFSEFRISQRYGCKRRWLPLTTNRMRLLAHYLKRLLQKTIGIYLCQVWLMPLILLNYP